VHLGVYSAGYGAKPTGFDSLRTSNMTTVRGFSGCDCMTQSPLLGVLEGGEDGRAMLDPASRCLLSVLWHFFHTGVILNEPSSRWAEIARAQLHNVDENSNSVSS